MKPLASRSVSYGLGSWGRTLRWSRAHSALTSRPRQSFVVRNLQVRRFRPSRALWSPPGQCQVPFQAPKTPTARLGVRGSASAQRLGASIVTFILGTTALGILTWTLLSHHQAHAEAPLQDAQGTSSQHTIRLAEVHSHGRGSARPWVIRGTAVYDITDFISSHPGGDVILNAAGGSIDPFWKIFNIHHKQYVYDILEQYRVGVIDPTDLVNGEVPSAVIDDPFEKDPTRDARMLMHTEKPCNAEPPGEVLNEFLTPNELFFVRNHLWVPDVSDPEEHEVTIVTFDGDEVTFTVRELRQIFKEHSVTAVLQCSGNRRSHMSKQGGDTQGLPWDVGAIGNAKWTGVLLRDVLREVGLDVNEPPEDVQHVQFLGSEAYGASIPIDKAVDRRGDVLLVYQMNDQPLPKDHGAPLRVLVPGHVAARSVKWVKKIILSDEESQSQWQQRDYKCFGPNIKNDPDWSSAPAIQEMPVQSAVTAVRSSGSKISKGADRTNVISTHDADSERTILEGYAFSGGGRTIVRVDVSTDGGRTWDQAELLASPSQGSKSWCWQRWQYSVPAGAVGEGFLVKAVDEAYNTQPEGYGPNWNFRGNLTCGWQRVPANKPEEPQGR